ncbi:hypothetical protein [Nonomuraea sp. NPDC049709]
MAAATPAAVGVLVTGAGFATAFALAGALALAAACVTPPDPPTA